jgi:hypothetical protein
MTMSVAVAVAVVIVVVAGLLPLGATFATFWPLAWPGTVAIRVGVGG